MQLSNIVLLLAAVASNVGASLALKWASIHGEAGAPERGLIVVEPRQLMIIAVALAFYILAFLAYMLALRKVPVSIAYPVITGSTSLLLAVAAGPMFGEVLTLKHLVGICLVISGSLLLLNA